MKPLNSSNAADSQQAVLPCAPAELRRFKLAGITVLTLCTVVFGMIMKYGNGPREFVDQMNFYFAGIVIVALAICVYALLRFRRACVVCREDNPST